MIKNFTDLDTWKEGHKLVVEIYKTTMEFPKSELFGLTDQMRRCSVSITSNIAEGFGRYSIKEKVQFFRIASGSLTELQNQLIISKDVNFIIKEKFNSLFDQSMITLKMINGLIRSTRNREQ